MTEQDHLPAEVIETFKADNTGQRVLDLATTEPATLERLFGARLDFRVRVFDLGMMNYRLVGGRVDRLADHPTALYAYVGPENRRLECQMYRGTVSELPEPSERRTANGFTFLVYSRPGHTAVFWSEGEIVCVLVSDMPAEDTIALALAKAMKGSPGNFRPLPVVDRFITSLMPTGPAQRGRERPGGSACVKPDPMRMKIAFRAVRVFGAVIAIGYAVACGSESQPPSAPTSSSVAVSNDSALFKLVSQTEPFGSYSIFPNADAVTRGTLNGSTAHQPMVRVSMNAKALAALQNGRLPAGSKFPDGAIIFKEVQTNGGTTTIYAVMYKDSSNPVAGNGWLWAEFSPSGSVAYSITNRGAACTGCHSLEQGPRNDFVRTFERQRP